MIDVLLSMAPGLLLALVGLLAASRVASRCRYGTWRYLTYEERKRRDQAPALDRLVRLSEDLGLYEQEDD